MKSLIWFFSLLLITVQAKAQIQTGRLSIGADLNQLSYQRTSLGYSTASKVLVTPSISYSIARNLMVNLGVPLGISNTSYGLGTINSSNSGYRETQTRIGISPSIRYYLSKSNFKPFLGFSYCYLFNQSKYELFEKYSASDRSNVYMPSIGLAYSLTQRLFLTTSLNYIIDNNDSRNLVINGQNSTISAARPDNKSLSIGVGVQIFLGE